MTGPSIEEGGPQHKDDAHLVPETQRSRYSETANAWIGPYASTISGKQEEYEALKTTLEMINRMQGDGVIGKYAIGGQSGRHSIWSLRRPLTWTSSRCSRKQGAAPTSASHLSMNI
jgi:hypothetical protein